MLDYPGKSPKLELFNMSSPMTSSSDQSPISVSQPSSSSEVPEIVPLPKRAPKTSLDDYLCFLAASSVNNAEQLFSWLKALVANKRIYAEILLRLHRAISETWAMNEAAQQRSEGAGICSWAVPFSDPRVIAKRAEKIEKMCCILYMCRAVFRIDSNLKDPEVQKIMQYLCKYPGIRIEDLNGGFSDVEHELVNRPIPADMTAEEKLKFIQPLTAVMSLMTKYQSREGALYKRNVSKQDVEPLYHLVHDVIAPSSISQLTSVFSAHNYDGLGERGRQHDSAQQRFQILLYALAFFLCTQMHQEDVIISAATKVQMALVKAYSESYLPTNIVVNVTPLEKEALSAWFFKTPLQALFSLSSHIELNVVQPKLSTDSYAARSSSYR